ncbi:MAG TPA: DUF1634 domain-containing protein [Bryobacteraceae bacterium]|jgi:uncharacterized membrane protein
MKPVKITDRSIENMISFLLRFGVLVSGSVVLAGGVYYLLRHGGEVETYRTFQGTAAADRILSQIVRSAIALRARAIIQLGLLMLIATPILRVAFSLVGFAIERDRTYVLIASIVLAVLLYSLVSGTIQG